jgi:chorismate lyase/3-hydroxybenzoate synthase
MSPTLAFPLQPRPPGWAFELVAGRGSIHEVRHGIADAPLDSHCGDRFTLLRGVVDDAAALPAPALVGAVAALYRALAQEVNRQQRHAVRIWNFVPDIQGHLDGGNRYMTFNAGRFTAYREWFGIETFGSMLPTASAVGVTDRALVVFVLAADEPGRPVENPRQIPSYRYSRRYGPRPPCFSRATKLGPTLLIGGTASILGQHSQHEGDVEAQVRETCRNIAALIGSAVPQSGAGRLQALRSLRVHVRDARHASEVGALLDQIAPNLPAIELVQAPLCRRELLVEIEGVAECPS